MANNQYGRKQYEQSLGDVLQVFLREMKLTGKILELRIAETWHKRMGKIISDYTQSVFFNQQENTLYVELRSAPLRKELSYQKNDLIAVLNEELGQDLIKNLVLR